VRPKTRGRGASLVLLALLILAASWTLALSAQAPAGDGPKYVNGTNKLVRPDNYREWVFLGSSLGLNYPAPGAAPGPDQFNNVFVNPTSYRSFMQTGKWPDRTIWVLELRGVGTEAVSNRTGKFQTSIVGFEANVKDSRFPDGWGYFVFRDSETSVAPLSGDTVQRCIDCHSAHTAVERTFVQFYPTLLEVAKKMGTVKQDYTDP
jgi:cytochrome P460